MSPWRLLDERDREWREPLAGVSLAAEIGVDAAESNSVLVALGNLYRRAGDGSEREKRRLLGQWPACLVVGMSAVAATHYEEGTYWQKLWNHVELDVTSRDQQSWGEAFLCAVRLMGLPDFPASKQRFLGPILMHGGIPTYCLKDLLRLLAEQMRRDPGLGADSFMLWAIGGPHRMDSLDKPVRRFIEDGGEYAYDTIARLLDLLDRLRDREPDLFGVGLPERLVVEARSLVERGLVGPLRGTRRVGQRRAGGHPRLALNPFGEGLQILLPSSETAWRVVVDGQSHDIRTAHGWPLGELAETAFPLARPARHVQVWPIGGTDATALTVVRDDDPLLVFTEDGEFLPPGRPLPPDVVWVLFPDDRKLDDTDEVRVVAEETLPFGWEGWTLLEVDLAHAKRLGLVDGGSRTVRGVSGPRLLVTDPVAGITGAHRQPVYGTAPLISLPADKPRTWHIELRRLDGAAERRPVRLTAREGEVDPWNKMRRPIAGTFELTILGPLGFRLHRRVAVAEGLSASYEPSVRLLTTTGLDTARVTLTGQAAISNSRLTFDRNQVDQAITYGDAHFVVTPPHLSVLHDDTGGGARWSVLPLLLSTDSIARKTPGTLLVRAPASLRLPWLHVAGAGVTQDIRPHGVRHPGQARYPLAQLKDTAAAVRQLDLGIEIGDRLVPVAFVRPQALASGVKLEGNQLMLTDCAAQPGLHVGIYAVYAPWREVSVQPVRSDGTAFLPITLRDAGPLRVLPAMENASSPWPYWPPPDKSFLVDAPLRDGGAMHPLSAFLAGAGPCPESVTDEQVWLLAALTEMLQADGAREDLRSQRDMRLRSYPVPALLSLARTQLGPAEALVQVISTGLASQQLIGTIDLTDVRHLWGRLRVVAALLSGELLSDPVRAPELIDLVALDHGSEIARQLRGELDPHHGPEPTPSQPAARLAELVSDAIAVLNSTPYAALASRVRARPGDMSRASAAAALAMRAAARTGSHRDFRTRYRPLWTDLAKLEPDLVELDIVAAQAAISAIDRHARTGE